MRLSIVDSFDKELAEYITGSACVEILLEKSTETGNFITIQDGAYRLYLKNAVEPMRFLRCW